MQLIYQARNLRKMRRPSRFLLKFHPVRPRLWRQFTQIRGAEVNNSRISETFFNEATRITPVTVCFEMQVFLTAGETKK
jgi:hypothetical protein